MTMIDQATVEDFARRYTAAWCSHDAGSVAAHFATNGSLKVNDGPPAIGRAAIAEVAQGFYGAFPDMQVLMDGVEREGERFLYHWTLIGTNTGPGGTGRGVRISGHESWLLGSDGLIAESRGQFDVEAYQRQLNGA